MTVTPSLRGAVAVSDRAGLDPDAYLGRLVMFTMPEENVSGTKLVRVWNAAGLDVDLLPDARQPVHIFQSACASVKQRRVVDGTGTRTEITADEVHNNGVGCIYQITVKVWDLTENVIEHEKAMRVTFDKHTGEIKADELDAVLVDVEQRIRDHFDANAKTIPHKQVREAVRATIIGAGGQNLRRRHGGVYFVPNKWKLGGARRPKLTRHVLDGLTEAIGKLYGDRADFYTIPLVNDATQQAMVSKHFALNVCARSQELMTKAVQRVRKGAGPRGVYPELLANLYGERRKLAGQIEEFRSMVDVEMTEINANMADLDQALTRLQDLADSNG